MPEKQSLTATATPRERFLADAPAVRYHRSMVDGDAFCESADAVMLEYLRKLARDAEPANAAVVGLKQQGAQEFLDLFKSFTEPPKAPPAPLPSGNLKPTDTRK